MRKTSSTTKSPAGKSPAKKRPRKKDGPPPTKPKSHKLKGMYFLVDKTVSDSSDIEKVIQENGGQIRKNLSNKESEFTITYASTHVFLVMLPNHSFLP